MSVKLNHFICPRCGHDFYAEGAYAMCDGCQAVFYVAQSRTCNPISQSPITSITFLPCLPPSTEDQP